jgi:two-component system, chemotaxis family, chemotaxis protein CheY
MMMEVLKSGRYQHPPCVLIVEDDDDVREFMHLLVSSAGYDTMTARDGQEALVKMRQRRPCMVLLDLQMPRMDGWEFRARQMQDLSLSDIPVVCVTAFFDPVQVTRQLGLRCISKPADFPTIMNALETTCGAPPPS